VVRAASMAPSSDEPQLPQLALLYLDGPFRKVAVCAPAHRHAWGAARVRDAAGSDVV
jgi:hypothetical protein